MKKIILILTILNYSFSWGQQIFPASINAGGSSYQNTSNGISFTIGELAVNTLEKDSLSLVHGFYGLNQTAITSGQNQIMEFENDIRIFPNPATQLLFIQIELVNRSDIRFILLDMSGKEMVKKIRIKSKTTTLDLSKYPDGIYFLNFLREKKLVATYKIIKKS